MNASSKLAAALVVALGAALAGCDRKPTDPPKPSAALSPAAVAAAAGSGAAAAAKASPA